MDVLWIIVFGYIGFLLFSVGILQILLVLTCSIPLTRKLQRLLILTDNSPYKKMVGTILIWIVLGSAVCVPIFVFASSPMILGFCIGLVVAFILSIGKLGMTDTNTNDWIASIQSSIDFEKFNRIMETQAEMEELFSEENATSDKR